MQSCLLNLPGRPTRYVQDLAVCKEVYRVKVATKSEIAHDLALTIRYEVLYIYSTYTILYRFSW